MIDSYTPVPSTRPLPQDIDVLLDTDSTKRHPLHRRSMEPHAARSDHMLRKVQHELELMVAIIERTLQHCAALQADEQVTADVDMERDAYHLRARVEGVSAQLDDTLRTLARLSSRTSSDP